MTHRLEKIKYIKDTLSLEGLDLGGSPLCPFWGSLTNLAGCHLILGQ